MADAAISSVVDLLLSVVKEQIQYEIQLVRGVDKELQHLSEELNTIRNVLDDADTRRFKDKAVNDWLRRLGQTSSEMEDVLEEWNYALLQQKMMGSQSSAPPEQKVCSFIPSSCFSFKKLGVRRDIAKKVEELKSRLDKILREKDRYNFVISQPKNDPSPSSWRVQSDSSVDLAQIQGRKDDMDILVRKLTTNVGSNGGLGYQILSIVGSGGLGKTTLAQLVYNDSRVQECFDFRIWVCVSDPFDVVDIAKGIIESITKRSSMDTNQVDVILGVLKDSISSKKILLVLDDVWNEQEEKWNPLKNALNCVGANSKILVTTRKVGVAEIMGAVGEDIHHPKLLSNEECWLLMSRLALSEKNKREFHSLEETGKDIAKKCNGLPLAAKTLGSVLRSKNTIQGWQNVLKSEMWELKQAEVELFPHLLLSYHELSPALKHCFSYCAFFPKDTKICVEELISIWMGLGYLGSNVASGGDEMELRGREYFEDLAMRSLFQDFERDNETNDILSCKMHDIVHDFAQFLRKNENVDALGMGKASCQVCSIFSVSHVQVYRSLTSSESVPPNICNCLTSVRVLKFSNEVVNFPQGMEKLIHLRWLNMRRSTLSKESQESICKLYFLQTLLLANCSLKEISRDIGNLVRLRHLELSGNRELKELPKSLCGLIELRTLLLDRCNLEEIPEEIGNLVRLRHLDLSTNEFLTKLPKRIGDLIGLQTLMLKGCKSLEEIPWEIGNLVQLRHIDLRWNKRVKELPDSMSSLVQLETLDITGCQDLRMSSKGVGELSGLRKITNLTVGGSWNKLRLLKKLICLTATIRLIIHISSDLKELVEDAREAELGNKIHLQKLFIQFNNESIGEDESSSSSSSLKVDVVEALKPNHNLKELLIWSYKGWRLPHWMSSPNNQIRRIILRECSEVSSLVPMGRLPCLEELCVFVFKKLKVVGREWLGIRGENIQSLVVFPKLKKLEFRNCPKWEEWEDIVAEEEEELKMMPSLSELTIHSCEGLKKLPHRLLRKAHSLQRLDIKNSSELIKCYGDNISHIHPQLQVVF